MSGAAQVAADDRRAIETLQTAELVSTHAIPSPFDETAVRDAWQFGLALDEYVVDAVQRDQDLNNLYTGIEYMRYLEGEKHLVFITAAGLNLHRLEHDLSLAAMANDARVVIDTIQTGGLAGPAPISATGQGSVSGQLDLYAKRIGTPPPKEMTALQVLKNLSELTGGHASVASYAAAGFDRIDLATRSGTCSATTHRIPPGTGSTGRSR